MEYNLTVKTDDLNIDDKTEIEDHEYMYKLPTEINGTNIFDALNIMCHKKFEERTDQDIGDRLKELNEINVPAMYLCKINKPDLYKIQDGYMIIKLPDIIFRIHCSKPYELLVNKNPIDHVYGGDRTFRINASQNINLLLFGSGPMYEVNTEGEINSIYIGYFQDKFKDALNGHQFYDYAHDRIYYKHSSTDALWHIKHWN